MKKLLLKPITHEEACVKLNITPEERVILDATHIRTICCLGRRQFQIFCLLGNGLSIKEISLLKGEVCAYNTVQGTIATIKHKFGFTHLNKLVETATRFIVYAQKLGITEHPVKEIPKRVFRFSNQREVQQIVDK